MSIVKSFTNIHDDYGPVPVWQWKPNANLDQILATIREYHKHGITECVVDAIALDALPDVVKKPIYMFCQKNNFRFWLSLKEWIYTKDSSLDFSTLRLIRYPVFENRVLNLAQYDNKIRALFLQKGDKYQYIPDVTTKDRIVLLSDEADQVLLFLEQPFDIPKEDKVDLAHYYERFKEEIGKSILGFFVEPVGFYRLIREISGSSNGKKLLWHDKLIDWDLDENDTIQKDEIYHLWFDDPENISRHRVQYYLQLNNIFKKFYSKKIQEFCEIKKIPIIGRFHFDEFLNESIQNYRHSDISSAVFSYAEKLTSSASWISNEKRTISETYAFSQWESTLQQMKANADWEYLKGIDKVLLYGDPDDPHVSKYSYWKYFSSY